MRQIHIFYNQAINWHDIVPVFLKIYTDLQEICSICSQNCFFIVSEQFYYRNNFVNFSKMALLSPCMKFENFSGQKDSFKALWKWQLEKIFIAYPRVHQTQDLCRKKCKKGIFYKSPHGYWKNSFLLGLYESLECLKG